MGLTSRFIAYPTFGVRSPEPKAFSFSGADALRRARLRPGAIRSLIVLGDDPGDKGWKQRRLWGGSDNFALCLAYQLKFSNADNAVSAWLQQSGGTYFADLTAPFAESSSGVSYDQSVAGEIGQFQSDTFQVAENAPWAIRFRLYKPADDTSSSNVVFRRGKWQAMISRGRCEIMKQTDAWTQTQEDTLLGYLSEATIDDATQLLIEQAMDTLYRHVTNIDLPGGLYEQSHTLVFIPENHGIINIFPAETNASAPVAKWQRVEDTDILGTGADGLIWPAGPVVVRSNGIACFWQVGRPKFATQGTLGLGNYKTLISGTWSFDLNRSILSGTTDVTMEDVTVDSVYNEVVVTLETTDTNFTPFFYAAYAVRAGGVRSGYGTSAVYDTDDEPLSMVEEIEPMLEAEHRRAAYNIKFRLTKTSLLSGLSEPTAFHYPAFEHCMGDLWIGGVRVVKNGIVTLATHENMKQVTDNLTRGEVMRDESKTSFCLSDLWAILDEYLMEDVLPVGDGSRLGLYIRECLALVGFHSNEYASVSSTAGRRLPRARPGENWRIQPSAGTSVGDWLRSLLETYGLGRQLWVDNAGVWNFGYRSTTPKHTFTTNATTERAFYGLSMTRDLDDSYNHFRVEGACGADGRPLIATWTIWASVNEPGGPNTRRFIGRRRDYPTLRDESLKTQSDCDYAVRTLARLHGKPGRYVLSDVTYRPDTFPGDFITLHGLNLELTQIDSGSIKWGEACDSGYAGKYAGRMAFKGREVEG